MKKRIICLFMATISVLLTFAACKDSTSPPTDTNNCTQESSAETKGDESDMLLISQNGETNYKIINSFSTVDVNAAVNTTVADLKSKTGATFKVGGASSEETDYEIVIGEISNRAGCKTVYEALAYTAQGIRIVGTKIYVMAYDAAHVPTLLEYLKENIVEYKENVWGISKSYSYIKDGSAVSALIPKFESETAKLGGIYDCGEGNYELHYTKVTEKDFEAYLDTLAEKGFTEYDTSESNENVFGTYLKGSAQINTCWYPSKKIFKIIYGVQSYLPATEPQNITAVCTPSITQLGREGAALSTAPGMSYVLQLSDGRYIIIDGGPGNDNDEAALLKFLQDNKPSGMAKPVIAAWFVTHAHEDHLKLANNFLSKYHDEIELEMVAYNFPDFETVTIKHEDPGYMSILANNFKKMKTVYFKNADTWVFHTGQKLCVGDAVIEIIYTHEDLYPNTISWGNHTSSAFRITLGGKTITILGDAEVALCQYMADVYGTVLKSDMLQLTHHGFNGAVLDLYKYIDPDICFWPVDENRFLTDGRCLGTITEEYIFNLWLRDDTIKKREHYHSSTTTTIMLTGNEEG